MKKQLKSLLLVVVLIGYAMPILAQSSTEGKEFWVALNITTSTGGNDHEPFICITTQHSGGSYTITNPADASFTPITGRIPPRGYVKIKASYSPNAGEIDLNKWYPQGGTAPSMSCQIRNVGLKVETTVESSIFVANLMPQSFDAANILPITALQTDYITQDYPGYDHGGTGQSDGGFPEITILATENNTQINIDPSTAVLNNNGTSRITKTLDAGQVLYITGENRASLSGTFVTSDKKIAVFTGVNNTDVPGPVSARDHLYEQNMPVDYWGTHFVVTRSMKKDANRIRVTAKENNTTISVDSVEITTIQSGETYEFELCSAEMRTEEGYTKAVGENRGTERFFTGEAHFLETSCPCAVFSYDVSENYYIKKGSTSERDPNAHGDPSMVWISPLEQQLNKITFGVMNTDNTTAHYVNIITPTEGASSLAVKEIVVGAGGTVKYGNNMVQPSDIKLVPGNRDYSYARIKLIENADSVYSITSDVGFIAHVYGSGDKESYAYSCGSAAVQRGVKVNGMTFNDGYRSDKPFCLDSVFHFNAKVGTDEITRVDWDFGDGTTEDFGGLQTTHVYTSPGWYDVTAYRYGQQVCTNIPESDLGPVTFSFYVRKADIIMVEPKDSCLSLKQQDSIIAKEGKAYLDNLVQNGQREIINDDAPCYEDKLVSMVFYGLETEETKDTITGNDYAVGYNGKGYDTPTDVTDTAYNSSGCYHFVHYFMNILSCVDLTFLGSEERHICPGEDLRVDYDFAKGSLKDIDDDGHNAVLKVAGHKDQFFTIPNENTKRPVLYYPTMTLPTSEIKKPGHYFAQIEVEDEHCKQTKTIPIDFYVDYPKNIMKYKFNNVIAVYKPEHGGNDGYEFTNYEWHLVRNSQDTILAAGPNMDVLYLGEGISFEKGDLVYVILTDKGGVIGPLRSCKLEIVNVPNYDTTSNQNPAPATKRMVNRQIIIEKGDQSYNIYGQRVR